MCPKAAVLFLYKISSGIDTFTSSLRSRDLVSGAGLNICLLVFGAVADLRILVSGATRALVLSGDASIFRRRPNFRVSMVRVQST